MIRARAIVKWVGVALLALASIGYFATQVTEYGRGAGAAAIDAVGAFLLNSLIGYLVVLAPMDWIMRRRAKRQRAN